ncbi:MAG: carboxypeptidase-like regulatory domain-containing protein, partial [Muribaculaceae bacterium]|nr:carboxypeptidase-like regulatory domain-containing protein [Muribaculaceae bacterium]
MKLKLFPLMLLGVAVPSVAQTAAVSGTVVDAGTGAPVSGATISIQDQGITVTTGPAGDFRISTALPGETLLTIAAPGYAGGATQLRLYNDQTVSAGNVILVADDDEFVTFNEDNNNELLFDESLLEDEEGNGQTVTALSGASDNIYYKFTRYGYSPLY